MISPDIHITWFMVLLPVFLYAEIHYRILKLFSRYFKRQPEIVADVPFRLGPKHKLPVLILIKDANHYPVILNKVLVWRIERNKRLKLAEKHYDTLSISDSLWYDILEIHPREQSGKVSLDVEIFYTCRGKEHICRNDNYKLTSHKPFTIFFDSYPRPRLDGWVFGDMHTHSHLTSDQVEFGAPFDVSLRMARALELDFFASCDHSYDLDDRLDDYLRNDPELPKWHKMWQLIKKLNAEHKDFVIIPGEELSAGNARNQNVHQLILNNRQFFAGSGDSAEKWLKTKPQIKISDVLPRLEQNALSFAAHPIIEPPFVQKLLIRRGIWTDDDLVLDGLHGAQFWNGDKKHFLEIGLKKWVTLLLNGHRLTLIAGTDAHGSFNRFRQIGTPHVSMREEQREIFGSALTSVFVEGELSLQSILDGLRKGRVVVTDGPIAAISFRLSAFGDPRTAKSEQRKAISRKPYAVRQKPNMQCSIGDSTNAKSAMLRISALSSPGYGEIARLDIVVGDIGAKKETRRSLEAASGLLNFSGNVVLEECPQPGYIRLELETRVDEQSFHCFTNPIYVS